MARIVLFLMTLMSASFTHAALWQIEAINTGAVFLIFNHNPGGLNPGPVPYFENITGGLGPVTYFAYPYSPGFVDDSHLTAYSSTNPDFEHLAVDFAAPLTSAGGIVGVHYLAFAWDGNFCRGDGLCIEFLPDTFIARSIASDVPLPDTALLILAAIGGLMLLRSRLQPRGREQLSLVA